ncbi:MAG TPA: hypothetical protein VMV74_11160 [Bacteroidales bacterium]|nr:hypothetical protein [Bacteroidales bacterium]
MKKDAFLILPFLLFSLFIPGCETENQQVKATLTDHSGCKLLKSATENDIPNTQSCISYSYDSSSGTLSLTHINAGFNCCPGKLSCDIDIVGDTLVIIEKEESALCDCDCLYDLYIDVSNLDKQSFIVKVIEPYCGDQQKLIFEVNILHKPSGSFCAVRMQYPWGIAL